MSRNTEQSVSKAEAGKLSKLRNSSEGKLIITHINDKLCAFLSFEGRIECITVIGNSDLGPDDIVIAFVKDVKKDIGACFIDYAEGKDGYLPLNKLPAGMDVKQGDLIPVKMATLAQKGKRSGFTAKINWKKLENGEELKNKASHLTRFSYVYRSESYLSDRVNTVFKFDEYDEIITDDEKIYNNLKCSFSNIRLYNDKTFGLDKLYSLNTAIEEALSKKAWLKCGGYLMIEYTEAMTVIDVNSGKFTPAKGTDKEKAYLKVNEEAAVEIARQLRLKNISGIIIADFINLTDEEDRVTLLEILKNETAKDTETVCVVDITPLGLVEITRKKNLPPLYEQFF
jgi:Ribonuclease G/E